MVYYYGWGIRYPTFLKVLKSMFINSIELGKPRCIEVFKTCNGKIEHVHVKHEHCNKSEPYSIVVCNLPDGEYQVENAYYENSTPYFITLENGRFNNGDMAIAGAYMWWCTQSNNPTGMRTIHLGVFEDNFAYFEGMCGELYHVHDTVKQVNFNIDKKTVSIETHMPEV